MEIQSYRLEMFLRPICFRLNHQFVVRMFLVFCKKPVLEYISHVIMTNFSRHGRLLLNG